MCLGCLLLIAYMEAESAENLAFTPTAPQIDLHWGVSIFLLRMPVTHCLLPPRGHHLLCPQPNMRIWREEVFGPVLCVATFESEEEGLQLANDSEYGLGGAVISADPDRCRRVVEGLECGIVWVNCSQPNFCQV